MKKQLSNSCLRLNQCLFFAFPNVCVRGKHSAWQSTHRRAEARTRYPKRNSARKPSSGRKGDRDSGGRSTRNFQFARILLSRALPQSPTAPAPSQREPFISSLQHKKHHQRKIIGGVCAFSAKVAEPNVGFFIY